MGWTVPTGGPRASRISEITQNETVSLHSTSGEVRPALQEEQSAFPGHRHGSPASFPWWALLFGAPGSAPFPGAPVAVSTAGPAAPSTGRVPTLPRIPQIDPRPPPLPQHGPQQILAPSQRLCQATCTPCHPRHVSFRPFPTLPGLLNPPSWPESKHVTLKRW